VTKTKEGGLNCVLPFLLLKLSLVFRVW